MRNHPQLAAHRRSLVRQAIPGNRHLTQRLARERRQDAQEGGFSGAVGTQQRHKFALAGVKFQVFQDDLRAKTFDEMRNFDHKLV